MKLQEKLYAYNTIWKKLRNTILTISLWLSSILTNAQTYSKSYTTPIQKRDQQAWDIHKQRAIQTCWKLYDLNQNSQIAYLEKWKQAINLNLFIKDNKLISDFTVMLHHSPTQNTYPWKIIQFKRIWARNSVISPVQNPQWFANINWAKKNNPSLKKSYPIEIEKYAQQPRKFEIITLIKQWEFASWKWWYEEIFYFVTEK
jgi:hypothetical protein